MILIFLLIISILSISINKCVRGNYVIDKCICYKGYKGEACDIKKEMILYKHGMCAEDGYCECDPDWSGDHCDKDLTLTNLLLAIGLPSLMIIIALPIAIIIVYYLKKYNINL